MTDFTEIYPVAGSAVEEPAEKTACSCGTEGATSG